MTAFSDEYGLTERASTLLNLLGSFYNSLYGGWNQVASYANAKNQAELQCYQELLELVATTSRFTVPIYHKQNWSILTLNQSQVSRGPELEYGQTGLTYGNQTGDGVIFYYGIPPEQSYDWPSPNQFIDCSVIVNRMVQASVVLTKGIDFIVNSENKYVRFRDNPFENPSIPVLPVYNSVGQIIDQQLSLWMFLADYDWSYIYQQFGYALSIYLGESSQNYKNLINNVFTSVIAGSAFSNIETLLALLTDTSLILDSSEVVQDIYQGTDNQTVITNSNVYKVPLAANLIVEIGQSYNTGQALTDSFTIYNPVNCQIPFSQIQSIVCGSDLLVGQYTNGLSFPNQNVPITVTIDNHGRTEVTFPIGGSYSDIQTFWNTVQSNGTIEGSISLAQLLDSRYPPVQSSDPTAVFLPKVINPMVFLLRNILRNNALVVFLNSTSFGPDALGLSDPRLFRMIIPPQNLILITVQISLEDSIDGSTIVDGLAPTFIAPNPLFESNLYSLVGSDSFSFSYIMD